MNYDFDNGWSESQAVSASKGGFDLWRVAEGHRSDECITTAAIIFHSQRPWPRQYNDKDAEKKREQLRTNGSSFSAKVSLLFTLFYFNYLECGFW